MSYDEQRISDQIDGGLNEENNFFEHLKIHFQNVSKEEMKTIWGNSKDSDSILPTFKEWQEFDNRLKS